MNTKMNGDDGYIVELAEGGPWLTSTGGVTAQWGERGIWPLQSRAEDALLEALQRETPGSAQAIAAAGRGGMNEIGTMLALMSPEAQARICRVTLAQLWLSEPEFRAKIEDKLKHVMHANQYEAASSLSPDAPRKEQMPDAATPEGAAGMAASPIR